LSTIAQTMGGEAIATYINPEEVVKRLAAAQGIDVLNLVKSMEEVQGEQQQQMQQQQQLEMTKQTAAMANTPMNDPSKNPQLNVELGGQPEQQQQPPPIE